MRNILARPVRGFLPAPNMDVALNEPGEPIAIAGKRIPARTIDFNLPNGWNP
jgi:hypothetical protein